MLLLLVGASQKHRANADACDNESENHQSDYLIGGKSLLCLGLGGYGRGLGLVGGLDLNYLLVLELDSYSLLALSLAGIVVGSLDCVSAYLGSNEGIAFTVFLGFGGRGFKLGSVGIGIGDLYGSGIAKSRDILYLLYSRFGEILSLEAFELFINGKGCKG